MILRWKIHIYCCLVRCVHQRQLVDVVEMLMLEYSLGSASAFIVRPDTHPAITILACRISFMLRQLKQIDPESE